MKKKPALPDCFEKGLLFLPEYVAVFHSSTFQQSSSKLIITQTVPKALIKTDYINQILRSHPTNYRIRRFLENDHIILTYVFGKGINTEERQLN